MEPTGSKRERARDAAVIALQGAGGTLKAVVFQKVLFYADLVMLRDHGHTITGGTYLGAKLGPLFAASHQKLIPDLDKERLAHQTEHGMMKPIRLTDRGFEYRSTIIPGTHAKVLKQVAERLEGLRSGDISEASHSNPGWELAWRAGKGAGNKEQTINMIIALQDPLLYDDEFWTDEPGLDASISRQLEIAENSEALPWE